jgi:type VI secretion system protein ImpJ
VNLKEKDIRIDAVWDIIVRLPTGKADRMRSLSRVVWSEGMYLAPHHFQTQARHFENSLHFATSAIRGLGWGFMATELDPDAITNGQVILRSASGVFSDGLLFDIPSCDPPPPALDVREAFSPIADSQVVALAIPARDARPGDFSRPTSVVSSRGPRYLTETHIIADELDPQDTAPLPLGRRNFHLLLDTDSPPDMIQLPLARVRRIGAGRFAYDTTFMPPILHVGASEYLMSMLHRLCGLIEEKAAAAAEVRAGDRRPVADQFRKEPVSFWYLHTLYTNQAPLRHHLLVRRTHPEDLFVRMLEFAGALSCFVPDADVRKLPFYDHESPGPCFEALDSRIRQWLQFMLPSPCISMHAEPLAPSFWRAAITDERHFHRARWVLELASAELPGGELIAQVPRLVKICSERFIQELVRRALPGASLTYLPSPPPEIPVAPSGYCFDLSRTGPCWEDIMNTRQAGFYVPAAIPQPRITLHIVPEVQS